MISQRTGRVQTLESWCLDLYDNFINKDEFDNLLECDEAGEVLL
jgi:hypothetical protein